MGNTDIERSTQIILKNASKAIIEAKALLERTEKYFEEKNISSEKIKKYLKRCFGNDIEEQLSTMVQRAIEDAREEVERNKFQESKITGFFQEEKPKKKRIDSRFV